MCDGIQSRLNREILTCKILGGSGTPLTYEICLVIEVGFVTCSLEFLVRKATLMHPRYFMAGSFGVLHENISIA